MKESVLNGESKDIVLDNISKLKEIFPEVITEDKIDFKKLELILGEEIDDSKEKYSFTWPGKTQAIRESQKQSTGTLRPCPEESKNWDTTQNLYIEGDNLEVLKLLQKGYYNKIKAIYIDPPYNTGKDFIYSDNYHDNLENYLKISGQASEIEDSTSLSLKRMNLTSNLESAGRYHSNWLNMMYPRIKLAKNILKEDGVLILSIDEKELGNLKRICDEIFGEDNCLLICSRVTKKAGKSSEDIAKNNDFLLFYSKTSNCLLYPFEHTDEGFKFSDEYKKERGSYKLNQTLDYDTLGYVNSLDYPIEINGKTYYAGGVSEKEFLKRKEEKPKDGFRWRWSRELFNFGLKNDFIVVKKYKNYERIYTKTYQNAKITKSNMGVYEVIEVSRTKPLSSLEFTENKYSNDNAKKNIVKLFEKNVFEYSKPIELIKSIIKFTTKNNDIFLDFFSGSSTSAQSVLEQNNEDFYSRRFIMIQIPEATDEKSEAFIEGYENICEIGKERIRRAGDKIVEESGNNDLDIGFKVFKLDSSNLEKWDPDYNNIQQSLTIDNIKEDRTNEDLVYEIMLKYGIDLTLPIEEHDNIYSIGFGALVICLDNNITKEIANDIVKLTENSSTSRVVFKDNGFKSDADKTNIKEILKINHIDEFITI